MIQVKLAWEKIDENLFRTFVLNGWLIKTTDDNGKPLSITFIPDVNHLWKPI